jgi:hypothetical protein
LGCLAGIAHIDWAYPLWVISGHVSLCEKVSAISPKADILRGG